LNDIWKPGQTSCVL